MCFWDYARRGKKTSKCEPWLEIVLTRKLFRKNHWRRFFFFFFFTGLFKEMGVYLKSVGVYLIYRTPPKRFTYWTVICYFKSGRPHFPVRIEGTCLFSSTCYYQICCRCAGERGRRPWWQCKLRRGSRYSAWPTQDTTGDLIIPIERFRPLCAAY